jgi:putative flippase GtrA
MNLINKHKNLILQIIKFGTIGFLNTVIDFSIYIMLTRNSIFLMKYFLIAHIISFIIANIFSFIMNKNITFKSNNEDIIKKYINFVSITAISLIISSSILFISVNYLLMSDIYGKILGTLVGMVWNFIMYKKRVFKEKIII